MNRHDVLLSDNKMQQADAASKRSLPRENRGSRHSFSAGNNRQLSARSLVRIGRNFGYSCGNPRVIDHQRKTFQLRSLDETNVEHNDFTAKVAREQMSALAARQR